MYCYFNLVGQLCPDVCHYSSRTVSLKSDDKHQISHHNIYALSPVCTMTKNSVLCLQKFENFVTSNFLFLQPCLQPETTIKRTLIGHVHKIR